METARKSKTEGDEERGSKRAYSFTSFGLALANDYAPSAAAQPFYIWCCETTKMVSKFVLVWCTNPFDVVYVLFMSLACSK